MNDEPEMTEQDIEQLAIELREREIARQLAADPRAIASSDTPRTVAADVIASDWLAARVATAVEQARAEWTGLARDKHDNPHRIAPLGSRYILPGRVGVGVAGRAEGAREALRERVEAAVRLISPEHITPTGARQIRAALAEREVDDGTL